MHATRNRLPRNALCRCYDIDCCTLRTQGPFDQPEEIVHLLLLKVRLYSVHPFDTVHVLSIDSL